MSRLICILCSFLLFGCIEKNQIKEKEHFDITFPTVAILLSENSITRNGAFTLYEGKKYSGFLTEYFKDGQLKSKTGYSDGLREGIAVQFYSNGSKKEIRYYHKNDKVGHHQGWWENGLIKFDYHFIDGKNEGELKEWYSSGQPYKHFTYVDGKENGSQKMWESDGKIRANYVVKNGHRYGLIGLKNCKSVNDKNGSYASMDY